MSAPTYDFGMIGLGVMGRNFLLNVADHGFAAAGLDKDDAKALALETEAEHRTIKGFTEIEDFVAALKKPRKIMMLVPAGAPVDSVIGELLPLVDKGDVIIDGGNSYFKDTERRVKELEAKGIHFLGVGVSGGAKGARFGPSIMPGGAEEAYKIVQPILEAVSAKVNGEPCVAYMGTGSAGHYVKMVHNGIEYALMQLIAEAYDLMRKTLGMEVDELHQIFKRWNEGHLKSFLIEITAAVFLVADKTSDGFLINKILDKAAQKGTGKWTSQDALDLGIPIPTIDTSVSMRQISALRDERIFAAEQLEILMAKGGDLDKAAILSDLEKALHFAFVVTFAQGMSLLATASVDYGYKLNLATIARIWRGGCIIRAEMLEMVRQAYFERSDLKNIIVSNVFGESLKETHHATRNILKLAIDQGIPTLSLSSALAYFDAYRTGNLPLNLVQAQRDFFGSHTYQRTDIEGVFHTEWDTVEKA